MRITTSCFGTGFLLMATALPLAQAGGQGSVPYKLSPESQFETGCFGPCDCAVIGVPLGGTFRLEFVQDNGLFRTYAVRDVDWTFGPRGAEQPITGAGIYRVGGEVAVQHELVLDLSVAGRGQHFDSGLVPGTNDFPEIHISVAARGFACTDTVLAIRARPSVTSGGLDPLSRAEILRVQPDPFLGTTQIFFALAAPARVDLRVYDVRGRQVRALARGGAFEPGPTRLEWDGCREDGRRCAAGTYLVHLEVAGRETVCRVVKLR